VKITGTIRISIAGRRCEQSLIGGGFRIHGTIFSRGGGVYGEGFGFGKRHERRWHAFFFSYYDGGGSCGAAQVAALQDQFLAFSLFACFCVSEYLKLDVDTAREGGQSNEERYPGALCSCWSVLQWPVFFPSSISSSLWNTGGCVGLQSIPLCMFSLDDVVLFPISFYISWDA
jgi:hypothetical protein